jgi:hypothetical protein
VQGAYLAAACHHALELAARLGWLPEGLTAATLVDWAASCSVRALEAVFPAAHTAPYLDVPLRLLAPRAALALCAAAAAALAAEVAARRCRSVIPGAAAILLAALLLMASASPPLVAALGAGQAAALAALLAAGGPAGEGAAAAAAAATMAVMQTQAYHVTGHLCEFAGLFYTAGEARARASKLPALHGGQPLCMQLPAILTCMH